MPTFVCNPTSMTANLLRQFSLPRRLTAQLAYTRTKGYENKDRPFGGGDDASAIVAGSSLLYYRLPFVSPRSPWGYGRTDGHVHTATHTPFHGLLKLVFIVQFLSCSCPHISTDEPNQLTGPPSLIIMKASER